MKWFDAIGAVLLGVGVLFSPTLFDSWAGYSILAGWALVSVKYSGA